MLRRILSLGRGSKLTALATLVVASGVAVGSGANFTSSSANPSNVFTSGSLSQSNSKANAAVLTASNMRPGDTTPASTVDIQNTGSLSGTFTLTKSNLSDSGSTSALSQKLTVTISDCGAWVNGVAPSCTNPTQKYIGTIAGMGTIALGTFQAGDEHRYQFTVNFPDGGTGGADNGYQGGSTSVEYDWNAVS